MLGGKWVQHNTNLTWIVMVLAQINADTAKVCTGTLIDKNLIVTAAHCVANKNTVSPLPPEKIFIKVYYSYTNVTNYEVEEAIIHPKYTVWKGIGVRNDFALVKTSDIVSSDFCPMELNPLVYPQEECLLAGYGQTSAADQISVIPRLYTIVLPLMCENFCRRITMKDENVFCFLVILGIGPCLGDSGSPLICRGKLVGVLSRGMSLQGGEEGEGDPFCRPHSTAVALYEKVGVITDWIRTVKKEASKGHRHLPSIIYVLLMSALQYLSSCRYITT